jgi:hypothetical protein
VNRLAAGKHTFGSARTRRSLAKQPEGPFGSVVALRPGELMPIDSTQLDVRAVLEDFDGHQRWIVCLPMPECAAMPSTVSAP